MDRRNFLELSSVAALGAMTSGSAAWAQSEPMKAKDLNAYLRSLCEVTEPSVDRIVIGDPETVINAIGTAWMPYWKTLRQAVAQGVNVLVVHEPTFYTHWDLQDGMEGSPQPGRDSYLRMREEKAQWIEEQGLVIIRCHDVLDKVPEFGIPFAWGQALGFANREIVRSETYYNVYSIAEQPALKVAQQIAQAVKALNQAGVAFYGDEAYPVKTVGLGTGCICDPIQHAALEPDLFIAIDDSIRTWTQTTFAEDSGRPLVVVNHGTSEEPGMKGLSQHLKAQFPAIPVHHIPQGCGYRWIG